MGGQAFADLESVHKAPINVPRLPPATYQTIASHIQTKLKTLFARVVIPREAPGKLDHGDIDFLVCGILSLSPSPSPSPFPPPKASEDAKISAHHEETQKVWESVQTLLECEPHLHISRGTSHSFGIPHPTIPTALVQVDVELCPNDDLFAWTHFLKSDSDLLQIIGSNHRHLGLTNNDRGMHVRVAEIEPYDKKKSLISLTRDPDQAMEILGLDIEEYHAGFATEEQLFQWVARGRFFSRRVFEDRSGVEKHNDRARMAKRPMFRRFVLEYVPAHPEIGQSEGEEWTRERVLGEALNMFSKHGEYERMMGDHRVKEAEEAFWKRVKEVVPAQGNSLASAVKGLRRWVDFEDGMPYITSTRVEETPIWTQNFPLGSLDTVMDWIVRNWGTAKALEKKHAQVARESTANNAGVR
ncbi:unnamed protein product [Periconia digitata]|uniref:Uncharacterized protein n=1 Tax=Periconia digitata TaxID=1303443 RepID=A0A9W4U638_9PLEO|nr:unnamed protein product [Periconia digitata]